MLSSRQLQIPLDDDASSSNFAHVRTPARALLKHRSGALRENAVYHGPMTVKPKGKSVFQTPFNHARKAPQTAIKLKGTDTPAILVSRPLGDKTPFPNRQQPPAQQLRTPKPQATKLLLEVDNADTQMLPQTPECLLLPSATRRRKSLRLPSAISKNLKTPATRGNHWDVSDGDIDLEAEEEGDLGAENAQSKATGVNAEVDDDDEIEYMPPKLPERPWTPPFDMPDYKTLGRALLRVAHGERIDDSLDVFYSQDIDMHIDVATLLVDSGAFDTVNVPLPNLEDDDPFSTALREDTPRRPSSPPTRSRPASVASTTRTTLRPGTALARPASQTSIHGRTTSNPTPDPAPSRTRMRPIGAAATSKIAGSGSAATATEQGLRSAATTRATTRTMPPADPPRATASRTVPESTRRAQPSRAASSRTLESGPPARPTTRAAGAATITARSTATRPVTRPTASDDRDVKGTKPVTSRSVASKPSSQPRAAGTSASGPATRSAPIHTELDLVHIVSLEDEMADTDYLFDV